MLTSFYWIVCMCQQKNVSWSPKFNRLSLNETAEFPFWGLNIRADFDLRIRKKREYEETK